jgi:hypothetical protein
MQLLSSSAEEVFNLFIIYKGIKVIVSKIIQQYFYTKDSLF